MLLAALLSQVSLFAHPAIKCKDRGVGHDSELETRACVTQAAWTPESYKELECRQTLKCFQWFSAAMLFPWQECPCDSRLARGRPFRAAVATVTAQGFGWDLCAPFMTSEGGL